MVVCNTEQACVQHRMHATHAELDVCDTGCIQVGRMRHRMHPGSVPVLRVCACAKGLCLSSGFVLELRVCACAQGLCLCSGLVLVLRGCACAKGFVLVLRVCACAKGLCLSSGFDMSNRI
eukprot:1146999-Pelagomonas_calceolata.AAC.6